MRILPMKCGKEAEQNLWNKVKGIVILTAVDRWLCKDLNFNSVTNEAWGMAKYLLENDEKTQDEAATVIACKLRKYLN